MHARSAAPALVFVGMIAGLALAPAPLRAGDSARTSAYAAGLQNADGGFSARGGEPSTLAATNAALRSLKNVGGSVRDVPAAVDFTLACRDAKSGGFGPRPGAPPDVRSTAVGLMALKELIALDDATLKSAIRYLDDHVKTFEDVRIAVAGLESAGAKSQVFPRWIELVNAGRNADGTFGAGAAQARDTGGSVVALLRMGAEIGPRSAIADVLKRGQRPDGGWSKDDGPSDLETSYRVMRAFFMLSETPDLARLHGFLASLRSSEGGSSPALGKPADQAGTYFSTTIERWARLLDGEPALVETAGFTPLSGGPDLAGWEGDLSLWSARDGMIVGKTQGLKHNDFLASRSAHGDFILKATFQLVNGAGNSGIMFRAKRKGEHEMSGYQADVGESYWGSLYDESRRNKTLVEASKNARDKLRTAGWNHYAIRAVGANITLTLNNVTSVQYTEPDTAIDRSGLLGLQVHSGGPTEVRFKDIHIQRLPTPREDESNAYGFHIRSVAHQGETRKYVVFIPRAYDGSAPTPVVLFLHGSGERGTDGVTPARVGLGPAIERDPEAFPFFAVFPQARETWRADSKDASAAMAALDDVMNRYHVDPARVILTGLSMGGAGAWELAASRPRRFAAVVPICGIGRPESAPSLKTLGIRAYVGDADRERTVLNLRAMTSALKSLGAKPQATEYRGVGHNSWDRAYNDPELIAWMRMQKRLDPEPIFGEK